MELADVTDSKSVELITRVGSSPTAGMRESFVFKALFYSKNNGTSGMPGYTVF